MFPFLDAAAHSSTGQRDGVLFAGTAEELLEHLAKADASFASAAMSPDTLSLFIEQNIDSLREAGIEALVERDHDSTRITLRSVSQHSTLEEAESATPEALPSPEDHDTAEALIEHQPADEELPSPAAAAPEYPPSLLAPQVSTSAPGEEPPDKLATEVPVDLQAQVEAKTATPAPSISEPDRSSGQAQEATSTDTHAPGRNFESSLPWLTESADDRSPKRIRRSEPPVCLIAPNFQPTFNNATDASLHPTPVRNHWVLAALIVVALIVASLAGWALVQRFSSTGLKHSAALIDGLAAGVPSAVQRPPDGIPFKAQPSGAEIQLKSEADVSAIFRQAANEKNAAAQYNLGKAYAEGRFVKTDRVTAYIWLVLARSNGNPQAESALRKLAPLLSDTDVRAIRVALSNMYLRGVGVEPDPVAAYVWLNLAELAGASDLSAKKAELEAAMNSDQLTEANTRTLEWQSRYGQPPVSRSNR